MRGSVLRTTLADPAEDGGGGVGRQPVAPCRRRETVKEVEDIMVVEPHQLDAAEPDRLTGVPSADRPVSEAVVLPVVVPPPVEVVGSGGSGEHVGRVVGAGPLVAVDRENDVDISAYRSP